MNSLTQNKCNKLSDTDIAVHIGGAGLGNAGSKLGIAETGKNRGEGCDGHGDANSRSGLKLRD